MNLLKLLVVIASAGGLDSFPGADAVSSLSGIDWSLDSTRNDLKAAVSPGGLRTEIAEGRHGTRRPVSVLGDGTA